MNATDKGRLTRVSAAVYDQPWFVRETELRIIDQVVQIHAAGERLSREEIAERLAAAAERNGPRGGARTEGGLVGVIPIYGMIFPRANLMTEFSGGATVSGIRAAFRAALEDTAIGSILFDIDSPGGYVAGVDEIATEIREARGRKPIGAISNYLMASAAYYIGAQADKVFASPSAMVGWIGCVSVHTEFSKQDEMLGITNTVFRNPAGKYSVNDVEPLTDAAKAQMQQIVDDSAAQFHTAVSKGRGVSVSEVKSAYGGGSGMTAGRAVTAGLVDQVATFDEAVRQLATGKVKSGGGRQAAGPGYAVIAVGTGSESSQSTTSAEPLIEHPTPDPEPVPEPDPIPEEGTDTTTDTNTDTNTETKAQAALALARAQHE